MKKCLISARILITILLCLSMMLSGCVDQSSPPTNTLPNPSVPDSPQPPNSPDITPTEFGLRITIKGVTFDTQLINNATTRALLQRLPLTLEMSAMPHEKYAYLSTPLPTNAEKVQTIQVGDFMLFGSDCLVLFYESFPTAYSYTRLGKIQNTDNLADVVGSGSVRAVIEQNNIVK